MKQFFKFMFASFAGMVLTLIVLLIIFAGMMASLASIASKDEVTIDPHTVLYINWKTPILDRGNQNPLANFNFNTMKSEKPVGLNTILSNLDKAIKDPNIAGIYLNMESVPAGLATTEEIRDKLLEFKKSGKFIVSFANNYDQKAYYLASLSNKIFVNPQGTVLLKGLSAQVMFYKNLMDKLDIKAQIIRGPNNKFKSAVEPFLYDKMSAANKEQMQVLLQSFWGKILDALSESRGVSLKELNLLADNLTISNAKEAEKYHLVDQAAYRDEVIDSLKKYTDVPMDENLNMISFSKYAKVKLSDKQEKISRNKIAVIYALGEIVQGKGNDNTIGSSTLAQAIKEARLDKNVKAIVMRVNSPGGDALASDIIRREVELAGKAKPFIVSMGDLAASGGYWISTNANYIFADPTTITGSIGVFGIIPDFQKFMSNKLGITFDKVMTNKNADFIDVMAPMSDLQKERLNQSITGIYNDFTALVARTRHLKQTYVDSIAKGRVWSGTDAIKLGLVDKLGGLQDAIAYASKKADLGENYRIVNYPIRKDFFQQLVEEISGDAQTRIVKTALGDWKIYWDQMQTVQKMKGVQARLPFVMQIQ
ncbi:MAG: signal peptide peptidase SppA [Bacteroidales bacterium]|nr:signal peptide peptidase SppA [Bacteroidales bacterium]